mgnify:CR=1 FL=1
MLAYLKQWISVWDYLALDIKDKYITFYSEGRNYWPYLKDIIICVLKITNIDIYYITSDKKDPGLQYKNTRLKHLVIDEGVLRNWLFQNINTKILIMTMPDLDNYEIKKSKRTEYYIYTHHALNSFSSALRKGAIDNFDIIFCPGPHHVEEVKMLEKFYNLPEKVIIQTGYCKIDMLIQKYQKYKKNIKNNKKELILIAPTWGKNGIIEIGKGIEIVDCLISQGYRVILRPHPETFKHSYDEIKKIQSRFINNEDFRFEKDVSRDETLFESTALVTDWSGIAWEYALALKKPILFYDTPARINNPDFHKLPMDSFENQMRNKCGQIWNGKDNVTDIISNINSEDLDVGNFVYNIGASSQVAAQYIKELADE